MIVRRMLLRTLQHVDVINTLEDKGVVYGDWRRVDKDYKRAYKWMCSQMWRRHIPLNGRPPMWAWPIHALGPRANTLDRWNVCLELDVPDEQVLVSHFDGWHAVMNNHYLATTPEEVSSMFERTRPHIEASWQRIFDPMSLSKLPGYSDVMQATFPYICRDFVTRILRSSCER